MGPRTGASNKAARSVSAKPAKVAEPAKGGVSPPTVPPEVPPLPDVLDQDPPLRGQRYACISFVSPESVLMDRNAFETARFLSDVGEDVREMLDNLERAPEATAVAARNLRERYAYLWDERELHERATSFRQMNEGRLLEEFRRCKLNDGFTTCVRGFKIRGVYETLDEARVRAAAIAKFDRLHNVYVAEVGCWCPWSPNPDDISEVVYAEQQLNTLMTRYRENVRSGQATFDERKTALMDAIASESRERRDAADGGPAVTMTVEEESDVELGLPTLGGADAEAAGGFEQQLKVDDDMRQALEAPDPWRPPR